MNPRPSPRMRRWLRCLAVTLAAGLLPPTGRAAPPLLTPDGFAVPIPGTRFEFPRDHGSHPEFKLEWWYLTGHLFAASPTPGAPPRRFGFQATFFRQAGPRGGTDANAAFGTAHLFLAHMALLDGQTGHFIHQERLNREGWDAAAAVGTLDVRNGDWSLRLADPADATLQPTLRLHGSVRADAAFTLTLQPTKPLVVFGENGVSRKGADATAASYYLTFSRLRADGELVLQRGDQAETLRVTGEAWMDHEISSSQLSSGQVGWDWLSVQLTDGRELMLYRLRRRDGTADPASSLTWVDVGGTPRKQPFTWEVTSRWTSPRTGATYPARIRVSTTDPADGRPVELWVEPLADAQELSGQLGGVPYWEGACRILAPDGRVLGSGYLELTGYAKELKL